LISRLPSGMLMVCIGGRQHDDNRVVFHALPPAPL
jgi:hypothetical protein